jgi:Kdo2-lipid IVA lauroyltransferase/acyltransferase
MNALIFYLCLPLLLLLSVLPFPVLYFFSDILFFFLYHVFRYRRTVVAGNLRNSFPEKPEAELGKIEKDFYRHLCDLLLETVKTLTMNRGQIRKRCRVKDTALENRLHEEGKSIFFVMGHLGNWEWAGASYPMSIRHPLYVIYKPLSNVYFDRLMQRLRSRFGAIPVPMKKAAHVLYDKRNTPAAMVFIADQTPSPDNAIWLRFLNQDTPVFSGTEKLARKFNHPVIYASVKKVKRGYYEIETEMLAENPGGTPEGEITERHTKRLEQDIRELPHTWLWSHRRWKHRRDPDPQI